MTLQTETDDRERRLARSHAKDLFLLGSVSGLIWAAMIVAFAVYHESRFQVFLGPPAGLFLGLVVTIRTRRRMSSECSIGFWNPKVPPSVIMKESLIRGAAGGFLFGVAFIPFAVPGGLWASLSMPVMWGLAGVIFAALNTSYSLHRRRFCPTCEKPLYKRGRTSCGFCGVQVDSGGCLVDPAGEIELDAKQLENDGPVRKLLKMVMLMAIRDRASEIRFVPGEEDLSVGYWIDGTFYDLVPPPLHLAPQLAAAVKALAGLRVPLNQVRQEGQLITDLRDHKTSITVVIEPSDYGEMVIMRLKDDLPTRSARRELESYIKRPRKSL